MEVFPYKIPRIAQGRVGEIQDNIIARDVTSIGLHFRYGLLLFFNKTCDYRTFEGFFRRTHFSKNGEGVGYGRR